jgi:hypothetical protein
VIASSVGAASIEKGAGHRPEEASLSNGVGPCISGVTLGVTVESVPGIVRSYSALWAVCGSHDGLHLLGRGGRTAVTHEEMNSMSIDNVATIFSWRTVTCAAILMVCTLYSAAEGRSPSCQTTIAQFGGVGDGKADDTAAVRQALSSGCAVSGEDGSYRVTGNLELPSDTDLSDATILPATSGHGPVRSLYTIRASNIRLTNVRIDRGSNPSLGLGSNVDPYRVHLDTAAIWLANVIDATLTDVEVFGDGVGTGIKVIASSNVRLIRPHVHDMRWQSPVQPENEVMVGIWVVQSRDVTIDKPRVANLTPTAIQATGGRASGRRNNMTDGVTSSGTHGLVIEGAEIWNVGEGFDFSGTFTTSNFTISGAHVRDVDSFCYKMTNRQGPGTIVNSTALRCGLGGYVLAGPVTGIQLINDQALDIGSNGHWKASSPKGFALQEQRGEVPTDITIQNSKAIDTQARPTMTYGFFNQVPRPAQGLRFMDSVSSGHGTGAMRGFP